MPVNDLHVAALRSMLVHDSDESRRLIDEMGDDGLRTGYFPLLTAAFMLAVRDHFRGKKRSDMVDWVADIRARGEAAREQIDPNAAEALILWVFGNASTNELDFRTDFGHQTMLLALLIDERDLDDSGLDEFLNRARNFLEKAEGERDAGPADD